MRGFLGGIGFGAVVAVLGAAMISLVLPLPEPPAVADRAPDEAPVPDAEQGADLGAPKRDADLVEAAPVVPKDEPAAPDSLAALSDADTQPTDKPEVGVVTQAMEDPAVDAGQAPAVAAGGDAPVEAADPSAAPAAPKPEAMVSISTEPAQPPAPKIFDQDTGLAPATGTAEGTDPEDPVPGQDEAEAVAAPEPVAEELPDPASDPAPVPDTDGAADPGVREVTAPVEAPEPADQPVEQADAPPVQEQAEPAAAAPEPEQADPEPQQAADPEDGDGSRIAALPQAGSPDATRGPSIGKPVVPLTERASTPVVVEEAEEVVVPPAKPILAHGAAFENPDERPLMSILLIDDGGALGLDALMDFPYPVSVALDPNSPDAGDRMAGYRAAGIEVVMLADLDRNAAPQDAETTLSVWMDRLPEVVAVLEGPTSGIQGSRALSDQVTDMLKASGHGLITQNSGLNTVQKLALREGVPSAVVFRDFDGAGQTPAVIRRFLDQAAFRAGQEGAVIMLGRLRPDTISALLLWGLQDRASRVALAPVSASLLSKLPSE